MERSHRAFIIGGFSGLVLVSLIVAMFSAALHPLAGAALIGGGLLLVLGFRQPYLFLLIFIGVLLARPAEFFPILGQLYPAKSAAVLALVAFAFHKLSRGDLSIVTASHNRWMLALALAAFASAILGSSFSYSVGFYREVFVKIIIIYFLMVNLLDSPQKAVGFMTVTVAIGVILSVFALYRSYTGIGLVEGTRVALEGSLADPNDLAVVLLLGAPFLVALTLETQDKTRFWAAGLFCVVAAGILSTQSRGGLLGLVCGLALLVNKKVKNKAALVVVLLVVIVGFLILSGISSRQVGGSVSGGLDESSATRVSAWAAGIRMFVHRPILGLGLDQFYNHYLNFAVSPPVYEQYDAHNSYIKALAETGLMGFVPFMALVWLTLKEAWRLDRYSQVVTRGWDRALLSSLLPTVVAVFAASIFLSHTWNWFFYILHALVAALSVVYAKKVNAHET